jgi:hypothetical protein
MREGNFSKPPERNPVTHAAHKREVFWQITFPLVIGVIILLALAVGSGFINQNSASQAADISSIWLILPVLMFTLILTFLFGGLAYGLIRLIGILPPYAALVQNYFVIFSLKVRQVSDIAVEPVLKAGTAWASLSTLLGKRPSSHS